MAEKVRKLGAKKWQATDGGNDVDVGVCCEQALDKGLVFGGGERIEGEDDLGVA